jgi:hypothetical protein
MNFRRAWFRWLKWFYAISHLGTSPSNCPRSGNCSNLVMWRNDFTKNDLQGCWLLSGWNIKILVQIVLVGLLSPFPKSLRALHRMLPGIVAERACRYYSHNQCSGIYIFQICDNQAFLDVTIDARGICQVPGRCFLVLRHRYLSHEVVKNPSGLSIILLLWQTKDFLFFYRTIGLK